MTKRYIQATIVTLLTAMLVLPPFGFARPAQQASDATHAAQEAHCYVKVETTVPNAKKDISNNEVSCSKVVWGASGGTGAAANLGKKECLDERGRVGKIQLQQDKKTNQATKTCFVQQFANAKGNPSPSQTQQNQQK
jgi:hypothetical protein